VLRVKFFFPLPFLLRTPFPQLSQPSLQLFTATIHFYQFSFFCESILRRNKVPPFLFFLFFYCLFCPVYLPTPITEKQPPTVLPFPFEPSVCLHKTPCKNAFAIFLSLLSILPLKFLRFPAPNAPPSPTVSKPSPDPQPSYIFPLSAVCECFPHPLRCYPFTPLSSLLQCLAPNETRPGLQLHPCI